MTSPENTATAEGAQLVGTPGRPAARASGEWPVDEPIDLIPDDLYVKRAAEHARHELVLDSIRANLMEQPTANSVLATVRHWISDVIAVGDEVAKAKQRST